MLEVGGKYRIGTRKSALAKTQSTQVQDALKALGVDCELIEIVSSGDIDRKTPLYEIEPASPGLFTKQLEAALLAFEIDIAVHSLKDLPTAQPPELKVAAVPPRVEADDCLLVRADRYDGKLPLGLPENATVGTSSLRREAQLLAVRGDLKVAPIRGNVPTRAAKARDGEIDAVVLAVAGIERLGLSLDGLVKVRLGRELFVSAPGQGALAIETRTKVPADLEAALAKLNDSNAETETRVERRVLQGLHGGCTLPLGVRCTRVSSGLSLKAFLGICEGTPRRWKGFHRFELTEPGEQALIEKTVAHFTGLMEGSAR